MQNISFDRDVLAQNIARRFHKFLNEYPPFPYLISFSFEEYNEDRRENVKQYREQAESMRTNDRTTLFVNFSHLVALDSELAEAILTDYFRHDPALRRGLQDFIFTLYPEYASSKLFHLSFYNLSSIEK